MKKLYRVAALAAAFAILSGCVIEQETGYGEADFDAFFETVRASRGSVYEEILSVDEYLAPTDFAELSESELRFELSVTTAQKASVSRLTISEAKSDVEALAKMLREDYGAYGYFGGDAAFEPLFAGMLRDVESLADEDGRITMFDFEGFLRERLGSVARDRALFVRDDAVEPDAKLYRVQDAYFTRDGADFYYMGSRVLSIDGEPAAEYLRPAVSPSGAIVYALWRSFPGGYDPTAKFLVVELEGEEPLKLRWQAAFIDGYSNYAFGAPFAEGSTTSPDGEITLPVVGIANLDAAGERFTASASRPADEKVLILDLRVAGGDDLAAVEQWIESYAGERASVDATAARRVSPVNRAIGGSDEPLGNAISSTEGRSVEVADGRLLIVLVGGNSGAAEIAQQLCCRLSNVLTVGGTSDGAALTRDPTVRYLPKSGARITFGTTLCLFEGAYSADGGVPLEPDLYANPADALVLARDMVKYYGLND